MRISEKFGRPEINASSMADIAFLLLTFFLMTTVINNEKGLNLKLPPWKENIKPTEVHQRNIFTVQINSMDRYLIEGEPRTDLKRVKEEIKTFILNYGKDENLSVNPEEAIVSLKADRGTSHRAFMAALDEIQSAYYELYAQKAGITPEKYRALNISDPNDKLLFEKGREGIPMNISIAEPSGINNR